MRGSLRAGEGGPLPADSCRWVARRPDRRVAHSRAKTAPDLAPCGVLPFDYLRKVQVMSANKDKSKKRAGPISFLRFDGRAYLSMPAQGGLALVLVS